MPKYTEHFHLEPAEIDLIEKAIRREIASCLRSAQAFDAKPRVQELNALLAKLFHQKKFYAHVNSTGIPAG